MINRPPGRILFIKRSSLAILSGSHSFLGPVNKTIPQRSYAMARYSGSSFTNSADWGPSPSSWRGDDPDWKYGRITTLTSAFSEANGSPPHADMAIAKAGGAATSDARQRVTAHR